LGYKKTGYKYNLDSNFLAVNDHNKCSGCGICSVKCPVDAITMKEKNGKKYADINLDRCIGCGVCKRFCPTNSITMKRKEELNYTPIDSFERCIMNAIEKGVLHKYIFDNFESFTQEMLRKIFSMIFELEPVKRIAISKKLRSKFLIALNTTRNINVFEKLYKEAERKKK
jgi:Pyruvate/2-oxoacid:ferredoxin oxidoreductase delta subunit